MTEPLQDVVVVAELDWDGLHCQSHVMANGFAARGHRVLYVNRTLQRWPTLGHLQRRLRRRRETGTVNTYAQRPAGLETVTLAHLPPTSGLRTPNRILLRRQLLGFGLRRPLVVVYVPTFLALDAAEILNADRLAYVCYHNFDADRVLPDLLKAEREILATARHVFADSVFLRDRITRLSGRDDVGLSPPGVYFERFAQARRGDEAACKLSIVYFGGIGPHLDLEIYNGLAEQYKVVFIGVVDPRVRALLSPAIEIRPPVANSDLPHALREMDIVTMFYRDSEYIRGVMPAKFFECLATGKPVITAGLRETRRFAPAIHVAEGGVEDVRRIIAGIDPENDRTPAEARLKFAREADWSERFRHFYACVGFDRTDG